MIQRIQTVYLFLALIALILLGTFPVVKILKGPLINAGNKIESQEIEISAFEDTSYPNLEISSKPEPAKVQKNHTWHYLNLAIWSISTLLVLVSIFLFKNRNLQILICWTSLALILALSALIYVDINDIKNASGNRTLGIGAFSLSAVLLLLLLARKQILKDENLVRSVDRLR